MESKHKLYLSLLRLPLKTVLTLASMTVDTQVVTYTVCQVNLALRSIKCRRSTLYRVDGDKHR